MALRISISRQRGPQAKEAGGALFGWVCMRYPWFYTASFPRLARPALGILAVLPLSVNRSAGGFGLGKAYGSAMPNRMRAEATDSRISSGMGSS